MEWSLKHCEEVVRDSIKQTKQTHLSHNEDTLHHFVANPHPFCRGNLHVAIEWRRAKKQGLTMTNFHVQPPMRTPRLLSNYLPVDMATKHPAIMKARGTTNLFQHLETFQCPRRFLGVIN